MFKWKDVGIPILIFELLVSLKHLVLDFRVSALHQSHKFLICINLKLFPLTQWLRLVKISSKFFLNLLPYLIREVFFWYVFTINFNFIGVCYTNYITMLELFFLCYFYLNMVETKEFSSLKLATYRELRNPLTFDLNQKHFLLQDSANCPLVIVIMLIQPYFQ